MENDVTTGCAEREPEPALDIRIVSLYSSSINHMNESRTDGTDSRDSWNVNGTL